MNMLNTQKKQNILNA